MGCDYRQVTMRDGASGNVLIPTEGGYTWANFKHHVNGIASLPDTKHSDMIPLHPLSRSQGIYPTRRRQSFSLRCRDDNRHPRSRRGSSLQYSSCPFDRKSWIQDLYNIISHFIFLFLTPTPHRSLYLFPSV